MTTTTNLLTLEEAAELLRVEVSTVQFWMRKGRLPFYRLSPRHVKVSRADVEAFLESSRIAAPPMPHKKGMRGSGPERRTSLLKLVDERASS